MKLSSIPLEILALAPLLAGAAPSAIPADGTPFAWDSPVPKDCPFPRSTTLTGITFTGRHSDYHCGDTWYPSWASDGNLYSPWTDGTTEGVKCGSGSGKTAMTGHAVMIGDENRGRMKRALRQSGDDRVPPAGIGRGRCRRIA